MGKVIFIKFSRYMIVFSAILILISSISFISIKNSTIKKLSQNEKILLNAIQAINIKHFENIKSDILFFANHYTHLNSDISKNNADIIKHMEYEFLYMANSKKIYDQIRFLDTSGMEKIRINYNFGNPIIVDEKNLQNKGQRYYFKDVINLPTNIVYVSPFDLNIEKGEIELPIKPMIRFGTTVYKENNEKIGAVFINYLGKDILNTYTELGKKTISNLYLVNRNGYYLIGDSRMQEWGFMYENKKDSVFENDHHNAWEKILNKESGSFHNKDGIYSFTTIYPLKSEFISATGSQDAFGDSDKYILPDQRFWKSITFIPSSKISTIVYSNIRIASYTAIGLFFIITFLLYLLSKNKVQKEKANRTIISNIKELEENSVVIKAQKEELEDKNKYLSKQKSDLEDAIATKDKLLSVIAHDLNNFLIQIKGFSELITENIDNDESESIKEFSVAISASAQNGFTLLSNLLDWSRVQTGSIVYTPIRIHLNDTVKRNIDQLKLSINRKNIRVAYESNEDYFVYTELTMLNTIIRNILNNAMKFSFPESSIIISTIRRSNMIITSITDSGIGISEYNQDKLFDIKENFTMRGTNRERGTGLGLTICKEFVEMNKGEIWFKSKEGIGTTFYFSLPEFDIDLHTQ